MKPIRMKANLRVADAVRRAVNRLNQSSLLMRRGHFECFDNCREQGYVLKVFSSQFETFCIAFSENRNSDDIVVYCFTKTHYPSNLPATANDWQDVKYFTAGSEEVAAHYILERAVRFVTEGK